MILRSDAPTALVVTSIHAPNEALRELAAGCRGAGWDFVVAGDAKSPPDFALDSCRFLSIEAQRSSGFALAAVCPDHLLDGIDRWHRDRALEPGGLLTLHELAAALQGGAHEAQ